MKSTSVTLSVLFSLFYSLTLAAAAGANNYKSTYTARIPAGTLSCADEVLALKKTFLLEPGVEVIDARCLADRTALIDGNQERYFDLYVSYQSKKWLTTYSAEFNPGVLKPGSSGMYLFSHYRDCVAQLTQQKEYFTTYTHLPALGAQCSEISGSGNYSLKIDGLGTPQLRLSVFGVANWLQLESERFAQIESLLAGFGDRVVAHVGTTVYFYTDGKHPLQSNYFGFYKNSQDCETQKQFADQLLRNAGASGLWVQCVPFADANGSANSTVLAGASDSRYISESGLGLNLPVYFALDECLAARQIWLSELKDRKDVLGALCRPSSQSNTGFDLQFYTSL